MEQYNGLVEEYEAWLANTGYPKLSADELLVQLTIEDGPADHRKWLADFIRAWDANDER